MRKPPLGRDGSKQQTEGIQGLRQNGGDIQAVPTVPLQARLHLQRRFNERLKLNGSRRIVALVFFLILFFVTHRNFCWPHRQFVKKQKKEVLVRLIRSWAHSFVSSFLPLAKAPRFLTSLSYFLFFSGGGGGEGFWCVCVGGGGCEEQHYQDVNTHTCAR